MSSIHGTVVAIGGLGVLLRGAPGSGKSSLALRLIDSPGYGLGAVLLRTLLVADDQVEISKTPEGLVARPPAALAGLLEIRGVGIVKAPHQAEVLLRLVVDLEPTAAIARMPEAPEIETQVMGITLKRLKLDVSDPAALAKIRAGLK
jgi:serine kinase of HPr protein (carbohydrate metabolism regulator)